MRDISPILQAAIGGILTGAVYGIAASGLSIIWGILRIINFAQGDFMMLAMFGSYWAFVVAGAHPLVTLPVLVAVAFVVGFALERGVLRPVEKAPPIAHLLYTAGLGLMLQNLAHALWGSESRSVEVALSSQSVEAAGLQANAASLVTCAIAFVAILGLNAFFTRARLGRVMRATVDDREVASLLGVNVNRVYGTAFALGVAVTALAGGLIVMTQPVSPEVGGQFIVLMFAVVVLGGMGSVNGALLGGLVIGTLQGISAQVAPFVFQNVIVFAIFMLMLLIRPQGLLGDRTGTAMR